MRFKSRSYWELTKEDNSFFKVKEVPEISYANFIRPKTWVAARRYALKEQKLTGVKVLIHKWRKLSSRSPKRKYGSHRVTIFTVKN